MTTTPTRRPAVRSLHRVLVLMHMTTAFGWLALSAAVLLLTVHGLGVADGTVRRGVFGAAARLDDGLLADFSFMTLYTGTMLAGLTSWGYTRFWWVTAKLGLALTCALLGRATLGRWLADAATHPVPGAALITGCALTIAALAFAAWAARTKPWGPIGRNRAAPREWSPPALWVLAVGTPVADYLTGLPLQAVPVAIVLAHHARRALATHPA